MATVKGNEAFAMETAMELMDQQVLEVIERIVGDDFCEDLDCTEAFNPNILSEIEKTCRQKLSMIYRFVHSHIKTTQCFHVHEAWRKEAGEFFSGMDHRAVDSVNPGGPNHTREGKITVTPLSSDETATPDTGLRS